MTTRSLGPALGRASMLVLVALLPGLAAAEPSDTADEIAALRAELTSLRDDYERRLASLQARLEALEDDTDRGTSAAAMTAAAPMSSSGGYAAVPVGTVTPVPQTAAGSSYSTSGVSGSGTRFNPAIGVILEGQMWRTARDNAIPGFPLGGEAGPLPDGLAVGETELNFSANVDDLFTARVTAPIALEDGESGIELEEAWVETLALPAGLSARFGRFFSNIGYLNHKHAHTWDFVDQPLAYQALLGDQYVDDGVQVRWLAPTDLFLEVGAEILRGGRYPATGAAHRGFGSHTVFARAGGDVGISQSWQAGLSYLLAESRDRPSGDEDAPVIFDGDVKMVIGELVWKWAPRGNWRQRNLVFQSEVLWRREDGDYRVGGPAAPFDADQTGWYAQLVYQPIPQWRVGARVDALSADDPGPAFTGTVVDSLGEDPRRYSLMLEFSHSEFSRLRLQYSRNRYGSAGNGNEWGLQYIHSIGAHGAHGF